MFTTDLDNYRKTNIVIVTYSKYPLVIKRSYWKWPLIVDFPMKNGDFQ